MPNSRYQLIIFDWEGTLGDTVGQSLLQMARERLRDDKVQASENQTDSSFKKVISQSIRDVFPYWSEQQIEQFCKVHGLMQSFSASSEILFPGAKDFIESLHQENKQLAIATNKGYHSLLQALQYTGLDAYFSILRAAGQVPPKPCPQMLTEILQESLLATSQALMVGDSPADIEMAGQIGMEVVGVDFYHQNSDLLLAKGAIAVFDNYQDLQDFINISSSD